jgi:hypothetical protein
MDDRWGAQGASCCDYGPCTAPVLIIVDFASGHLQLCRHHWNEARGAITGTPTYRGIRDLDTLAPVV